MASAPPRLMTAEEFWDFVHRPENQDKSYELVRGEVEIVPRARLVHGVVSTTIAFFLLLHARQHKRGYVCSNDTGVVVERDPDTVRGPDVMYYENAPTFKSLGKKWGETPPRLAVEVLSPNDSTSDVNRRIRELLDFGTPLLWLVDPEAMNVRVYRPGQEYRVYEANEEITGEEILPEFRCVVAEFFKLPEEI